MNQRESAFWTRLKANRLPSTFAVLATLAVGILIGTVISKGVKGQETKKASDATPLTVPAAHQSTNQFTEVAKQSGAERRQHQHRIDHQEPAPPRWPWSPAGRSR